MTDELEPDLARLLRAESRFEEEPEARRERVLAAVHVAAGAGIAASAPLPAWLKAAWVPIATGVGGALLGAVLATAVHTRTEPAPSFAEPRLPEVSAVEPAPEPPIARAALELSPVEAPVESEPEIVPPRAVRRRSPAPAPPSQDPVAAAPDLRAEQRVLESARAALARGDVESALGAVDRHARTFPAGLLAEERDALRILALLRADRSNEADGYINSFRARYPGSFLLRRIEAARRPSNP